MRPTKRKRVASPAEDSKEQSDKVGDMGTEDGGKRGARGRKKTSVGHSSEKQEEDYLCWLLKSEPESRMEKGMDMKFGIEDLKAQPEQTACWDGVRNYQARNFMRAMKNGQEAFFYHSNCKEPGIAGIIKIVKEAYTDHTQFDRKNPHYDASSSQESPKWSMGQHRGACPFRPPWPALRAVNRTQHLLWWNECCLGCHGNQVKPGPGSIRRR